MAKVKTSVRIEGMEDAVRAFRSAPKIARKYLKAAAQISEGRTRSAIERAAPRGPTGMLAHAFSSSVRGIIARVHIETGLGPRDRGPHIYWRFVEFGTVRMAARPFIRPATEAQATPFIEECKAAMKRMERDLQK